MSIETNLIPERMEAECSALLWGSQERLARLISHFLRIHQLPNKSAQRPIFSRNRSEMDLLEEANKAARWNILLWARDRFDLFQAFNP